MKIISILIKIHKLSVKGQLQALNLKVGVRTHNKVLRGMGGGTLHMKQVGMLVISFRGVNFGFWSHLGCSGKNAMIFSCEDLI